MKKLMILLLLFTVLAGCQQKTPEQIEAENKLEADRQIRRIEMMKAEAEIENSKPEAVRKAEVESKGNQQVVDSIGEAAITGILIHSFLK